jgi:hypothetical protein
MIESDQRNTPCVAAHGPLARDCAQTGRDEPAFTVILTTAGRGAKRLLVLTI